MSLTGDDARLRELVLAIERIASPEMRRELLTGLGEEFVAQVHEGFSRGQAPSGAPWAPLRLRSGQPLRDTGRLQRSITHRVEADTVLLTTHVAYARVHQYGATIRPVRARALSWTVRGHGGRFFARQVTVPARPFFPGDSLPGAWETALREVAEDLLGEALERV